MSSVITINGLQYDPLSGEFVWIVPKDRATKPGSRAGSTNSCGHRQMRWNGRQLMAHRLAWFFVYGEWPRHQIDHVNGNPGDNRISNLRQATSAQNNANRRVMRDGLKGASWSKRSNRWKASICSGGKKIHLGYHDTEVAAHDAYVRAARKIHGEFERAQ